MTGVLVVDDSRFVRDVVGDALTDHGFEVAIVSDGHDAVEYTVAHDPDVVTMDVEMPGMDGIEATERIMEENPTPVVMLAADDDADATLSAIASGAVDFVGKGGDRDDVDVETVADELVRTVEAVAGTPTDTLTRGTPGDGDTDTTTAVDATDDTTAIDDATATVDDVVTDLTATPDGTDETTEDPPVDGSRDAVDTGRSDGGDADDVDVTDGDTVRARPARADVDPGEMATRVARAASAVADEGTPTTVVVGASTGGPGIVEGLLAALPTGIGARVVVVQHMPEAFTGRLALRLDGVSDYDVQEVTAETRVSPDEAVLASGDRHLEVVEDDGTDLVVAPLDGDPVNNVRPSVDVTMVSAAAVHDPLDPLVGVVLTGMGSDGARGTEAIADAGGATIAQDRQSSPVYGMPGSAVDTGAVDRVASVDALPAAVRDAVRDQQRERQREEAHA